MPDITAAVSEDLFARLLGKAMSARPPIVFSKPSAGNVVWFGAEGKFRFVGCDGVDFEDGNTFLLSELDLGWEQLKLSIGLDLPSFQIGGFCVIPIPKILGGGCVRMKRYTVFAAAPDIGPLTIDLSPILSHIVSEISGRCSIAIRKTADKREIYVTVHALDVDLIDLEGTVAQLNPIMQGLVALAAARVVNAIPGPGWLLDFVLGKLGLPTPTSLVLDLLDIGDDLQEWLMDVLNVSIGLPDLIEQLAINAVLDGTPVASIDDPYMVDSGESLTAADYGGFAATPPASVTIPEFGIPLKTVSAEFSDDFMQVVVDLDMP